MELQEAVAKLQAAGLVIKDRSRSSEDIFLMIARAFVPIEDDEDLFKIDDGALLYSKQGNWGFRKWDSTPGPGPDDIEFHSQSLESIFAAVMNYYFGEPLLLDSWIFPVHKHPEWDRERLPELITSARELTSQEWQILLDAHIKARWVLHPHKTLSSIYAHLFIPIYHQDKGKQTLQIRRDLAEAFYVSSEEV